MALFRSRSKPRRETTNVFFATDLHGSDHCFKKFLNARTAYGAHVLILGGDMTGKLAVPIVADGDGTATVYAPGSPQRVDVGAIEDIEGQLRKAGFYPFRMSEEESETYRNDPSAVERKHHELMKERLVEWSAWAERKLDGTEMEILVAPGNDDPFFVDDVLRGLPRFRLVEDDVVEDAVPGLDIEILSTGYSNPTPWKTHRELPEDELRERLEGLASRVRSARTAIFNIHVPPYGSQLDEGPIIDAETLKKSVGFGQDATVPVGSTAVRELIEEHQPMLSLHGHIHESRAIAHIGHTLAINPGSDYSDGVLRGAFIELTTEGTANYQLTSG